LPPLLKTVKNYPMESTLKIKNYNRDIMDWKQFPDYDWLWCDPPWEQGLVKMFQTMMLKQTGKTVDHTIDEILSQLGKLANPNKPLVVEYGVKGVERVEYILKQHGHTHFKTFTRTQTQKDRPYKIVVFNSTITPSMSKGFAGVTETALQYKPKIVFDPFAGIGASAKAFRKAGVTYIGSELNPARYAKLVQRNP